MMTDMEEAEIKKIRDLVEQDDGDEGELCFSEAAKKLTAGLLSIYQLPLEQVEKELTEVTSKQETLLGQLQIENRKLEDMVDNVQMNEMFKTVRHYQGKLSLMKKEMASVHERAFKLKKRALRLQQIKQKEALNREQQREQEIRREEELIGKPIRN